MKKKLIIIIIAIVLIVMGYIIYIKISSEGNNETLQEAKKERIEESHENKADIMYYEPNEITIYDIEDGYLTVRYNSKADKHKYDFDKFLDNSMQHYKYEDDNYKTKFGIDVSDYQGEIDWKKVKEAGVEFAILRLGYRGYGQAGRIVLDEHFEENYQNAINNGIEVGVYFFSQSINNDEVREEADFVLRNIEGKQITYPVAFDLEKIKNDDARTDNLTNEEITNMTLEFCKIIESKGYIPSIYGNSKTLTTKMTLELFNDYNKWYADYLKVPLYPYEFNIWQYSETGKIDGIEGSVDLDVYFEKIENR